MLIGGHDQSNIAAPLTDQLKFAAKGEIFHRERISEMKKPFVRETHSVVPHQRQRRAGKLLLGLGVYGHQCLMLQLEILVDGPFNKGKCVATRGEARLTATWK